MDTTQHTDDSEEQHTGITARLRARLASTPREFIILGVTAVVMLALIGGTAIAATGGSGVPADAADSFAAGEEIWDINLDNEYIVSGPSVAGGYAYLGSTSGEFYAVDLSSRSVEWSFSTPGYANSAPIIDSGDVYFPTSEGVLYSVDAGNGNENWNVSTNEFGNSLRNIVVDDGVVYTSLDDNVTAINTTTQSIAWKSAPDGGSISSSGVVASDNSLYVSTAYGGHALDKSTGSIDWSISNVGGFSSATYDSGSVYFTHAGGLSAVDRSSGAYEWNVSSDVGNGPPTIYNGSVVYGSDGGVYSVNTTGTVNWQANTTEPYFYPTAAGGGVYTLGDTLNAYSESGEFRYSVPNASATPIVSNGILYTGTSNGELKAFDTEHTESSSDTRMVQETLNMLAGSSPTAPDDIGTAERLELTTDPWLDYSASAPYEVFLYYDNGTRQDVTAEAGATSSNVSVVTVNETSLTVNATADTAINNTATITAAYNVNASTTFSDTYNVTVANVTVQNLDILPAPQRFAASLQDTTLQVILISTAAAAAGSIIATPFAGVAVFTIFMTGGWFAGFIGAGMVIVAVLISLFVGLNVANNLEMQYRP